MSIFIADLDHFKKINDKFGHSAGDEVLRLAARTLRRAVREGDFVARYGGEEFVVVAPNCDLEGAISLAERFRGDIADLKVCFRNQPIQVTCSVGVAPVVDASRSNDSQTDALEVLDQADRALFQCKDAGRNAVWFWDTARGGAVPANLSASEALTASDIGR